MILILQVWRWKLLTVVKWKENIECVTLPGDQHKHNRKLLSLCSDTRYSRFLSVLQWQICIMIILFFTKFTIVQYIALSYTWSLCIINNYKNYLLTTTNIQKTFLLDFQILKHHFRIFEEMFPKLIIWLIIVVS